VATSKDQASEEICAQSGNKRKLLEIPRALPFLSFPSFRARGDQIRPRPSRLALGISKSFRLFGRGYHDRGRKEPEDRPKAKHPIPDCAPWLLVRTHGRFVVGQTALAQSQTPPVHRVSKKTEVASRDCMLLRSGRGYHDRGRKEPEDRPKAKHPIPDCAPWLLVRLRNPPRPREVCGGPNCAGPEPNPAGP
jgi:hypothetical protein